MGPATLEATFCGMGAPSLLTPCLMHSSRTAFLLSAMKMGKPPPGFFPRSTRARLRGALVETGRTPSRFSAAASCTATYTTQQAQVTGASTILLIYNTERLQAHAWHIPHCHSITYTPAALFFAHTHRHSILDSRCHLVVHAVLAKQVAAAVHVSVCGGGGHNAMRICVLSEDADKR